MDSLTITESLSIEPRYLSVATSRSSGPGGQHVNKVETKVRLRFDLPDFPHLNRAQKQRLRAAAGRRLDADGALVLTSDATRSKIDNLENARRRLAQLVRQCLRPPKPRKKTKPTRGSKERRLKAKRVQSERKRGRNRDWD